MATFLIQSGKYFLLFKKKRKSEQANIPQSSHITLQCYTWWMAGYT